MSAVNRLGYVVYVFALRCEHANRDTQQVKESQVFAVCR